MSLNYRIQINTVRILLYVDFLPYNNIKTKETMRTLNWNSYQFKRHLGTKTINQQRKQYDKPKEQHIHRKPRKVTRVTVAAARGAAIEHDTPSTPNATKMKQQ
jgi:hypothetical protein